MADPSLAAYLPAGQALHSATFDSLEYLPTAHAVQMLAPVLVPVFVIEPAAQSEHDFTSEAAEYLPASHAVHVVAPVDAPLSVIEPAAHSEQ